MLYNEQINMNHKIMPPKTICSPSEDPKNNNNNNN